MTTETIHQKLEQLKKLQQQVYSLRTEIESSLGPEKEIQEKIYRVAEANNSEIHRSYNIGNNAKFEWSITGNEISVRWEEFWAYGGHDSGSFGFPISYILNDDELKGYENKRELERLAEKEGKEKQDKAKELREFEILKKKLFSS